MKSYQKPIVFLNNDLTEGVYTASGDAATRCDSQHIKGNWLQGTNDKNAPNILRYGCQGCPADSQNGCKLEYKPDFNPGSALMPTWEKQGYGPYDTEHNKKK